MRHLMWVVVIVLLVGGAVEADDGGWQAWIALDKKMVLIDSQGETLRIAKPPLMDSALSFIYESSVSPDGRYVIYVIHQTVATQRNEQVIIYDLFDNKTIFQKVISVLNPQFNRSGSEAAYLTNLYKKHYRVEIVHLPDGKITRTHDFDFTDLTYGEVQLDYFDDFKMEVNLSTDTQALRVVATANGIRGEDQLIGTYSSQSSFDITNERLMFVNDAQFGGLGRKFGEYNSLQIYNPLGENSQVVYSGYLSNEMDAAFVQDGKRILLREPFRYMRFIRRRGYDAIQDMWLLMERNGRIVDQWTLPINQIAGTIRPTPNGFIYTLHHVRTDRFETQDLPTIFEMNTDRGFGQSHAVWTVPTSEMPIFVKGWRRLSIAWVG